MRAYLMVSALIFGAVSSGHIVRVMYNMPFQFGTFSLPMWLSWIALLASAALCVWAIGLVSKKS